MTESSVIRDKTIIQSIDIKNIPQYNVKITPVKLESLPNESAKSDRSTKKSIKNRPLRRLLEKGKYNPRYLQETESVEHLKQKLVFRTHSFL